MMELLSSECWWVSSVKVLFGLYLFYAGAYLAILTVRDLLRCRRLMVEHLIHLTCAGSAWGVALLCII